MKFYIKSNIEDNTNLDAQILQHWKNWKVISMDTNN